MTHHFLYWLDTGWWCLSLMSAPIPCVSMACLLLMRLPWLDGLSVHFAACSWPLVAWMFPWAFVLYVLPPSWARPCLIVSYSFSNPSFSPFVGLLALFPCHSVILVVLLYDSCLLGSFWGLLHTFPLLNSHGQYYHWASIHTILGFLDPFQCFWASLAHLILLGILGPFPFLGHPQPVSFSWASSTHFTPMGLC